MILFISLKTREKIMKKTSALSGIFLLLAACSSFESYEYRNADALYVSFIKPSEWGRGVFESPFPPSMLCKSEGGVGKTPALYVENIPENANLLIMEINNLTNPALAYDGGMGSIGFYHEQGQGEATLLPVSGETFRLPKYAFLEKPNRVNVNKPYAYMPPCTVKGGEYSATIKAVRRTGSFDKQRTDVLAIGTIYLGDY